MSQGVLCREAMKCFWAIFSHFSQLLQLFRWQCSCIVCLYCRQWVQGKKCRSREVSSFRELNTLTLKILQYCSCSGVEQCAVVHGKIQTRAHVKGRRKGIYFWKFDRRLLVISERIFLIWSVHSWRAASLLHCTRDAAAARVQGCHVASCFTEAWLAGFKF